MGTFSAPEGRPQHWPHACSPSPDAGGRASVRSASCPWVTSGNLRAVTSAPQRLTFRETFALPGVRDRDGAEVWDDFRKDPRRWLPLLLSVSLFPGVGDLCSVMAA